ncbi:unnamed protein product, partial [Amoebophrya sp. A25]
DDTKKRAATACKAAVTTWREAQRKAQISTKDEEEKSIAMQAAASQKRESFENLRRFAACFYPATTLTAQSFDVSNSMQSRLTVSRLRVLHDLAGRQHGAASAGAWASIAATSSLANIDSFATMRKVHRLLIQEGQGDDCKISETHVVHGEAPLSVGWRVSQELLLDLEVCLATLRSLG